MNFSGFVGVRRFVGSESHIWNGANQLKANTPKICHSPLISIYPHPSPLIVLVTSAYSIDLYEFSMAQSARCASHTKCDVATRNQSSVIRLWVGTPPSSLWVAVSWFATIPQHQRRSTTTTTTRIICVTTYPTTP